MSPVETNLVDAMTGEVITVPPTDLWSDEPPLETDWHREQVELLLACLKAWWRHRSDFYASGNLTIYFNEDQIKSRDFRGTDFFVVLGTDPHPRKSWVLWGEDGKYPNVIVEMLSASTATIDRTTKKQLYQDTFRTPEYFWFHPETLELQGFCLTSGEYQPIQPNAQGWLISHQLNLYLGIFEQKLRFFTLEGELVPTPQEMAAQAEEMAAQAEERAAQAEERARRLEERLRSLGFNPEELE